MEQFSECEFCHKRTTLRLTKVEAELDAKHLGWATVLHPYGYGYYIYLCEECKLKEWKMEKFLEQAINIASGLSGSSTFPGGMATVGVFWNPYETKWVAKADWSDSTALHTEGSDHPIDALLELIDMLQDEEKELKNDKSGV